MRCLAMIMALAVGALLAAPAEAQTTDVPLPRAIEQWAPAIQKDFAERWAILKLIIDEQGRVANCEAFDSDSRLSTPRLCQTLRTNARFAPGKKNGRPVEGCFATVVRWSPRNNNVAEFGWSTPMGTGTSAQSDITRYFGFYSTPMKSAWAQRIGAPDVDGLLIQRVDEISPADRAGLREGDVVLALNGQRFVKGNDPFVLLEKFESGETVTFEYWRNGKTYSGDVIIGASTAREGMLNWADENRVSLESLCADYLEPQTVSHARTSGGTTPSASSPSRISASSATAAKISTGPRFALVIGNSAYGAAMGSLPNPANDAVLMAQTLKNVGFDVELLTDASQKDMKRAISRLGERLGQAGRDATGLFFYAGHGVQSKGVNYMIPVDAPIAREGDLDIEAVAADAVLSQMEFSQAGTNLIVLDACRNMPLARSFRSASRGLARMNAPNGSYIAYSTAPGSVAADGEGSNSPFAQALARHMTIPNLPIETMFRRVRKAVYEETEGLQTPWDSSSLLETFLFRPGT